jgi:hypothetical protein
MRRHAGPAAADSLRVGATRPRSRIFADPLASWVIGLAFLALAANWIVAIGRFQVNVLYLDQWGFFTPIMEGRGWWGLFDRQHGPHRQGLAFLLTSGIMSLCHWDTRIDSVWICLVLISCALLGLLLKRRIAGPLRAVDAWIVVAILALGQCETVIITPNASHSAFPLLLTLALGHIWLSRSPAVRYLASGICTVCLAFTGFGVVAAGVATLFIGIAMAAELKAGRRCPALYGCAALLLCIAGWALFLSGYAFNKGNPGSRFPWTPATDYLWFVAVMLTAPAGWDGASTAHCIAGLLVLLAFLALLWCAVRSFLSNPTLDSGDAVISLLGVSALLFCADAALGRVQLGTSIASSSRYVTLVTQVWLAAYLWVHRLSPAKRRAAFAALWLLVACPYLPLLRRPAAEWRGSLGLSPSLYETMQGIMLQKLTFASAYLRYGDARVVASKTGSYVFLPEEMDYLEERLAFQRREGLSFFSHPDKPFGYAPWFSGDVIEWLLAFPREGNSRWIGADAQLETGSRAGGYLNFKMLQKIPALPADATLRVRVDDEQADIAADQGATGVSIPVPPGGHDIRFESPGGALPAGNGDPRKLSFSISEPVLSREPLYVRWAPNTGSSALIPDYEFRTTSGFYGWEDNGDHAWISDRLEVYVRTSVPLFLNLSIKERLRFLKGGPVIVVSGGFRKELSLGPEGLSISLAIQPRPEPYHILIMNSTGSASPAQFGDGSDSRMLALKLNKLDVGQKPSFQPLELPVD